MAAGERERIFLYGTLRRGGSRDASKFYPGAEYLADARVGGVLHDLGAYPGLRLAAAGGWVRGELFAVSAAVLAGLDEWEGIEGENPDFGEYRRVRVHAHRDNGATELCWVYEMRAERCAGLPVIWSGDWLRREPER